LLNVKLSVHHVTSRLEKVKAGTVPVYESSRRELRWK
jgi:hypothetical protein